MRSSRKIQWKRTLRLDRLVINLLGVFAGHREGFRNLFRRHQNIVYLVQRDLVKGDAEEVVESSMKSSSNCSSDATALRSTNSLVKKPEAAI